MQRLSFVFRTAVMSALMYTAILAFNTWVSHLNTVHALP